MCDEIDHKGNYRKACLHIMQHDDWETGLREVITQPEFPLGLNQISQISKEATERYGERKCTP